MRRAMTQRELEDASGILHSTISDLERGEITNPTLATIRALAMALDIPAGFLLGEVSEEIFKRRKLK
jgi:transcriptional regulator with XRE-family HTH domain